MPVNRLTPPLLAALACLAGPAVTRAQVAEPQPLPSIQAAAVRALTQALAPLPAGVHLAAVDLDARLRLPACRTPLQTQALPPRANQARALVRVACTAEAAWSLNVPVAIERTSDVLVARRALLRGEAVGAADVTVQSRTLPGLASPFVSGPADLAGRITRRAIPEGTALTADALTAALLIHRGQAVTLVAAFPGLEIRAPGRALADASSAQRLRVQNLESLKVVEGVAESDGVVRVSP